MNKKNRSCKINQFTKLTKTPDISGIEQKQSKNYKQQIQNKNSKVKNMNLQHQVAEIRSLIPIVGLNPIYSIQRKPWCKVYRAQCMIPFPMYSIKLVYIITFIAYKIYVTVQLYLVPMVYPSAFPIQESEGNYPLHRLEDIPKPIPLASYSYNCIYCARCNLGMSCKSHYSRSANFSEGVSQKSEMKVEDVFKKQQE